MAILVFSQKRFDLFSHNFLPFFTLKKRPSRSRSSASGVNEKCIGGQGEMPPWSKKSGSGFKEKCIGVKEKCFHGMCGS